MPLVNTSTSQPYHDNWRDDATQLWFNHILGTSRPVGHSHIPIGYCRFQQQFKTANRARYLVDNLPLENTDAILIVGVGFGWLAEHVQTLLPSAEIVALDTGAWVQANKDQDESADIGAWLDAAGIAEPDRTVWLNRMLDGPRSRFEIVAEDMSNNGSRNRVLQRILKSEFDWGITEHVLEWLTDAECSQVSSRGHQICTNIAHIVTPFNPVKVLGPEPNGNWNWKHVDSDTSTTPELEANPWYTTTNWSALLPSDIFVVA